MQDRGAIIQREDVRLFIGCDGEGIIEQQNDQADDDGYDTGDESGRAGKYDEYSESNSCKCEDPTANGIIPIFELELIVHGLISFPNGY